MKNILRVLVFLLVLALVVMAGLLALVRIKGRDLAVARLSAVFGRPVSVGDIRLTLPLSLTVDGVSAPGLFEIASLRVDAGFLLPVKRRVILERVDLYRPVIWLGAIVRQRQDALSQAPAGAPSDGAGAVAAVSASGPVHGVLIKELRVEQGTVYYRGLGPQQSINLQVNDVSLRAQEVPYPLIPTDTAFAIAGRIAEGPDPFVGQRINGEGWINLPARNMDARIAFTAGSGAPSLKVSLLSQDNDLTVRGQGGLTHFVTTLTGSAPEGSLAAAMGMALQTSGVDAQVNFSFQTRMDDFRVEKIRFEGDVVYQDGADGADLTKGLVDFGKKLLPAESAAAPGAVKEKLAE